MLSPTLKRFALCAGVALVLETTPAAATSDSPHWGYGVENGPANWAKLNDSYKTCGSGKEQSPVDISTATRSTASNIAFDYRPGPTRVVNNGHSIQVNVAKGNKLKIGEKTYHLLQFHFHTPSENTVGGLHYPMEAHLVHADDNGALAVISVMVRVGAEGLIDKLPRPPKAGDKADGGTLNAAGLLPTDKSYNRFRGSLTTPPCTEGVTWIVMSRPIETSNATMAQFYAILGANNRPTHPLNGRKISLAK